MGILLLLAAAGTSAYALGLPNLDRLSLPVALVSGDVSTPATTPSATDVAGAESPTTPASPTSGAADAPRATQAPDTTPTPMPEPTVSARAATETADPTQVASTPQNTQAASPSPTKQAAEKPKPKPTASTKPKPPAAQTKRNYYTVQEGDSLFGIAAERNVSVQQLAVANGLTLQSEVFVGQRLLLPTKRAPLGIKLPKPQNQLGTPRTRPLAEHSPALVSFLEGREGTTSVALYLPETDTMYTYNPDKRFLMASTIKVPIMLTHLATEYAQDPNAAGPGTDLLTPMIVVSDNAAATTMFGQVGGKRAIEKELRARGVRQTRIEAESWGLSTTTAPDMALLMRSLYYGQRLNPELRQLAIGLLGGIVEEQRWGVPEGLGDNSYVAFKGGWLPDDVSWQVHQVGIADVGGQQIIFSIYTSDQPDEIYGRQTLEGAAEVLAQQATR